METLAFASFETLDAVEPLVLGPDDVNDASVLAAALALIDDACATDHERMRRRRVAFRRNEAKRLRMQINELQRTLHATRAAHGIRTDETLDCDLSRLWAHIAVSQHRQRHTVEDENERLRTTAKRQREDAASMRAFLDGVHAAITQATLPRVDVFVRLGGRLAMPPQLLKYLDRVCNEGPMRAIETTTSSTIKHACEIQWNAAKTAVRFRFRSQSLHPFKLSSVTHASWTLMQEDDASAEQIARDEVCYASARTCVRKSFGCMEFEGPVVLRRTFPADGSVVLAGVSMRTGTDVDGNVMAGMEVHETLWIHAVRVDATSPMSPVCVESVSDVDVTVLSRAFVGDTVTRLQRAVEFMERSVEEDKGVGRQQLENRLLDGATPGARADTRPT